MNNSDAFYLASEFKALYDAWEPSPAEVDLYVDLFQRFDKELVNETMRKYRISGAGDRRVPKVSALRAILYRVAAERAAKDGGVRSGPQLAYIIESEDGKYKIEFWWPGASVMPEWDVVLENHATKALRHMNEVYGGQWVIVRPEPPKPMGKLRGHAAFLEAEALIAMQTEETPGKVWLSKVYADRAKAKSARGLVDALAGGMGAKPKPRKPLGHIGWAYVAPKPF